MLDMGIFVQTYQSDNGIFAAADFLEEINKGLQNTNFSGVGAHHRNGIAGQGIQLILMKTCLLLIHAAICWLDVSDTSLWPMAVDCALHQYNHMPRAAVGMMSPLDLLLRTQSPQSHFKDMHVWGCPCYVLDPMLQDGHKLPKWKPWSHCGIFVGFSPHHSLLVLLVLNTQTGKISPQFHVVFDYWFMSVALVGGDDAFNPTQWQQLYTDS